MYTGAMRRPRPPLVPAALCALALAACGGEPPAALRVSALRELGVLPKPATIRGRDGGVSGWFAGRSVWVYGDTVATSAGTFPSPWRNNTMSFTTDLDASDGVAGFMQPADRSGAPLEFFPRTATEQAFNDAHLDRGDGKCAAPCGARYAIWGGAPLWDAERGRALLTYAQVYGEPGDWNFHLTGTSLAVWERFEDGVRRPEVAAGLPDKTLLFDAAREGEYSIGVMSKGWLYLYSCSGGPWGSARQCRLARAGLDQALRRDAWEFRGAEGWTPRAEDAAPLFDGSPNMTVHWNERLRRWLAVYMDWGELRLRTAPELWGPWSAPLSAFRPPEQGAIHGLAHPEYQAEGGRVEYVSYLAEDEFRLLRLELEAP